MATQTASSSIFVYQGVNKGGKKTSGEIRGTNQANAKALLRKQGIIAQKVKKKAKPLFGDRKKPITPMDISVFTRQLATMLKAGVPLVQAFEIVADGLDNPSMRQLTLDMKNEVAGGSSLAYSLEKHPQHFDDLFCSLVGAGEQSGALETMLDRVATYKEKTELLKAKIKKAVKYPIAVVCIALVVTGILLIKVVPVFAETFNSFGGELPAFTQFVMEISEFVQAWWYTIVGTIAAAVFAFKQARQRSEVFSDKVDAFMLKAPIVGPIVEESVFARFGRTLATTFSAGVPLVEALESVAGAAGNSVYAKAIRQIRDEVTSGTQLNVAIRASGLFPSMMLQMVAIGEESGALDQMLDKVATHFENEVDNKVDGLTSMLEPMIMSVLGVLIGGLMIAMYMPLFMLGSVI
ncbi:MAG: type II secretion system F family protein [Pseudomonadales bacterium]